MPPITPQEAVAEIIGADSNVTPGYVSEAAAIAAVKSTAAGAIKPGDTIVLAGIGPAIGMPETYQITSALKYHPHGRSIALVTDGRFSGVSTGACIGHVSPEAWAGGPLGKVHDGDVIRITIDTRKLEGTVEVVSVDAAVLATRPPSGKLQLHPDLPDDTRLWAALQNASGGSWGDACTTRIGFAPCWPETHAPDPTPPVAGPAAPMGRQPAPPFP